MKLRTILFLVLACMATVASAQTMQEVLYLKNGSIIKGTIIEQVPDQSLKIRTADGSIFVYPMDAVEKITKEATNRYASPYVLGRQSGGLSKGYRGFFDFGGGPGVGEGDGRVGFSTSHGYQTCPYFFIGAGFGMNYHAGWGVFEIPIFAHLRVDFIKTPISPFFSLKIGYSVYDGDGFYMEPSVGCRFGLTRKLGVNIAVGYELQMLEYYDYYYSRSSWHYYTDNTACGAITFKLAFDF